MQKKRQETQGRPRPKPEEERIFTDLVDCGYCGGEDEFCSNCCGSGSVWLDQEGYQMTKKCYERDQDW